MYSSFVTFYAGGDVISSIFDDDDPSKEREAEMLLEYIEHFNELFEEGKYKDAAMHAASSPKGILRNCETLSRFRAIHARTGKLPPLLVYCEALISSVPAVGSPPDAETSLECVKSALSEDRLDLVMHWLLQERLTCSEPLGHLLYNYTQGKGAGIISKGLPLAEAVYTLVEAHIQAAVCMCKQGKVQAMMDYAINAEFEKDMYMGVLVACPSIALAEVLIQPRGPPGKPTLSVGTVVFELLQTENYAIGVQLLDRVYRSIQAGDLKTSVKDMVLSDLDTTSDAWIQIANKCHDSGLREMALQVQAAVLVLETVKEATDKMLNSFS
ncbi:clathrin heavy chain linker domain-containing protein 1-like isoform X3 [Patiria miniata]|uniref:Uncharacterized protein n=1 Tax=Patiria miniata TaxID=46514 RepID=A0A913ZFF1_PATMI|nr:clathrin heavy chain linker domain-containing protein 1-like isoform X3 [Patiria miniata]